MPYNYKTPEEFISAPDTAAFVLDSGMAARIPDDLKPLIIQSKPLIGGYVIVYLKEVNIEKIITDSSHLSFHPLVFGLLGEAELDASGISQVHRQPYLSLTGSGVLLGFIDTGIDYTMDAFRYEDGSSKIQYIWDQTISGAPPAEYLFGTEYSSEDINNALQTDDPFELVPHRDTVGHGTFLASVAGSREKGTYAGAAPDAEFIVVKLKRARPTLYARYLIPPQQENAFGSDDFMLGVQYILEKAHALGRPVAICVSVGTNLGTHDGFTGLETYLSKIAGISGTAICAAAGNEAQARHHTQGRIPFTGETKTIEFRASDKHEDILVVLLNYASDRMSVSVKSPTGEVVSRAPARSGTRYSQKLILERSTVIIYYSFPTAVSGGQITQVRLLSATPGVWTITVHGDSILDGIFHAYLPLTGFIDPETVFLSPMPSYTIVTPATTVGIITAGAYDSYKNSLYALSSWGPSRLPTTLPDLTAPGVDVAGLLPGRTPAKMSGTSVASAITTGACALMLQWGIVEGNDNLLDSYRIRANLIVGCEREPNVEYPNNQWGYGRLNLYNTFRSLRPQ